MSVNDRYKSSPEETCIFIMNRWLTARPRAAALELILLKDLRFQIVEVFLYSLNFTFTSVKRL